MKGADWLFLVLAAWIILSIPASVVVGSHLARRGAEPVLSDEQADRLLRAVLDGEPL